MSNKKVYKSPVVDRIQVDREISMVMMSETPPPFPELQGVPGWPESGWVSKVFKLMVR